MPFDFVVDGEQHDQALLEIITTSVLPRPQGELCICLWNRITLIFNKIECGISRVH